MPEGRANKGILVALATASIAFVPAPEGASAAGAGSFSPTGSMGTAREIGAAVPLADGRVLIAGGYDHGAVTPALKSAEIYDPATGAFSPTGSMATRREGPVGARLPDGRVLIAGGRDENGNVLQTAEIFNPTTNMFSGATNLTSKRLDAVAAPLPDKEILVAGGFDGSGDRKDAEAFNPTLGTFSMLTSDHDLSISREGASAAALSDGRVLVAGGYSTDPMAMMNLDTAEVFDETTGMFSPVGSMGSVRAFAAAAPLPGDLALVAGGRDATDSPQASAEVFDASSGSFSSAGVGSLPTPREGSMAAPLPGGRVLVAGGVDGSGTLKSAEIYTEANQGSNPPAIQPTGRRAAALKKCKKKAKERHWSKKRLKRCKKKANPLPV